MYEIRKAGVTYAVYADADCLPARATLKQMAQAGYLLYKGGKKVRV